MKKFVVTIVLVVLIALAVFQAVQINSLKEKAPQAVPTGAVVADVDGDVDAGTDPSINVVAPDAKPAPVAAPRGEE